MYLKETIGGIEGLCSKLKSDPVRGLNPTDFDERDARYGSNFKAPPVRTPFCELFMGALDDFMLKILMICAVLSITIEMIFAAEHRNTAWIEGFAILVAVMVVSTVGAWNDYKKEE
jgi:magnesium-transporting ATPase (P-type)